MAKCKNEVIVALGKHERREEERMQRQEEAIHEKMDNGFAELRSDINSIKALLMSWRSGN